MDGTDLKMKFDEQWGSFRKFISLHPLTGFWGGVLGGIIIVKLLELVL